MAASTVSNPNYDIYVHGSSLHMDLAEAVVQQSDQTNQNMAVRHLAIELPAQSVQRAA